MSRFIIVVAWIAALLTTGMAGQDNSKARKKLPSAEKVVADYLKAIGGKKRVAAIRDATYEWSMQQQLLGFDLAGKATTTIKAPDSTRTDITYAEGSYVLDGTSQDGPRQFAMGQIAIGANARSAWKVGNDGRSQTLTDVAAQTAKLQALLDASRLVELKKRNIMARTVELGSGPEGPAWVVEFSLRNGARLRYSFSVATRLLISITDETQKSKRNFSDYRAEQGVLEPHNVELITVDQGLMTFNLKSVTYNSGLADALFDPPGSEKLDVEALLREVDQNQDALEEQVGDYTYIEKRTEREINGSGETTKETVRVYEVYPVPGREAVRKLISENGVALTGERAAKEEKRVAEELEKAERERERNKQKREEARKKGKSDDDDDPGIGDFLRATELVSPRRERLRDREAVVFDFRPRANYKPVKKIDSIVSKLAGVVWIDPIYKQVMRLEARLTDSYKIGGGLLASVRPGTAFIFEQKRMDDGVWLPYYTQINISAKVFLFKGFNLNVVQEFSSYHRFSGSFDDYKLTRPEEGKEAPPTPR